MNGHGQIDTEGLAPLLPAAGSVAAGVHGWWEARMRSCRPLVTELTAKSKNEKHAIRCARLARGLTSGAARRSATEFVSFAVQMTSWGVLLPTFDPLRRGETFPVAEAARIAERTGYASVWAGDHLKCPAPVLDATTCLAVAATVTTSAQIGFSVMLLGMRPLAWAAKQIATLQHLSGNRLRLGVGVGGEFPQEYEAAEVPHNRRGARLDEALRLLPQYPRPGDRAFAANHLRPCRRCWSAAAATALWSARRGSATHGCRCGCRQRRSPSGASGWQSSPQQYGRPAPSLSLLVLAHVDDDPLRAREQAAAHLRGQYGMALELVERWTAFGSAQQVAEFLEPYTRIGVGEILLLPLGARPLEQIERLADARSRIAIARQRSA